MRRCLRSPLLRRGCSRLSPAVGVSPIEAKKAEARQVYDQVIELDRSLSRADEQINLANLRLAHVKEEQRLNRHELIVARRNLGRGREMIQKRLVSLYTSSKPDARST